MPALSFQDLIQTLNRYWAEQGCVLIQPLDTEVGAGTFHPATFLRALGPEPWRAAYVQPSRRPADGRYGQNPNRLQRYYQYQVVLKPNPDDIVELYRISPDTVEGRCPAVLRDFLEVRGIGVLNIRTIFGETAVRPRKLLKLIVHLEDHSHEAFSELDRLKVEANFQEVLGVPVRRVTIPVAAGRNLAVLVEAAVRNFVLNQRGIDSTLEFIERQQKLMDDQGSGVG